MGGKGEAMGETEMHIVEYFKSNYKSFKLDNIRELTDIDRAILRIQVNNWLKAQGKGVVK